MSQSVCFVINRLESLHLKKDTSLAFMLEAQARDFQVFVTYPEQLHLQVSSDTNRVKVMSQGLQVSLAKDGDQITWAIIGQTLLDLTQMKYVFMRQDPPVDVSYINTTYMLDFLSAYDVCVVNNPTSVRSANEKLFAYEFPECIAPSIVGTSKAQFHAFLEEWNDIIVKPLNGMGGQGIFRVKSQDQNLDSIIEMLSDNGKVHVMAQKYIPEITQGDKRILLINGQPIDYALARVPAQGQLRGNLAAGGRGIGLDLTDRDRWLCDQIGPELVKKGLYFVGLDVIGDYVTEINVTSPTCVRELDAQFDLNISGILFDQLEYLLG